MNELGHDVWIPLGIYGYKVEGGSMRGHFFYIDGNNRLVEVREGKKKKGTAIGTCYDTGDTSKGRGGRAASALAHGVGRSARQANEGRREEERLRSRRSCSAPV